MESTVTVSPSKYLNLSPDLIRECATGLENWVDVAVRYGFSKEEWAVIEQRPEVIRAIEIAKKELYDTGVTFKNKAKLMADHLLNDTFKNAMSELTPVKDKAAALQLIAKLADLEPKPTQAQQGSGFSISINIPITANTEGFSGGDILSANAKTLTTENPEIKNETLQVTFRGEKDA